MDFELLQHGLVRASFIPAVEQRDLRDLVRHRANFIRERVNLDNRVQKVLEAAIKLGCVLGCHGRIRTCHAGGDCGWANHQPRGDSRVSERTIAQQTGAVGTSPEGRVRPHHRFILAELLCQIDSINETIKRFNEQIEVFCL